MKLCMGNLHIIIPSYFIDELQEGSSHDQHESCSTFNPTSKTSRGVNHQVQMEENDLTEKQKATLANLKEAYGFSSNLILLAFKECSHSGLEEVIERWCITHVEEYDSSVSDAESEHIDNYSEPGDAELEENMTTDEVHSFVLPLEISSSSVAENPMPTLAVGEQMSINKYHPFVKRLLEAGYPLEQCIDAAKRHPNSIHKAIDYLSVLEDSNQHEKVIPVPVNKDEPEKEGKFSAEHTNGFDHG